MQRRYAAQRNIARHFALGVALTGLMLTFLAAALLVFPHKLAANPEMQGELLYDLLGNLEYQNDGRFSPVDDPVMQQNLETLVAQKRLNGREGVAYILNAHNGRVVWQSAPVRAELGAVAADDTYAMQFKQTPTHQLAVQNFWLKADANARLEFRMVVALPIH